MFFAKAEASYSAEETDVPRPDRIDIAWQRVRNAPASLEDYTSICAQYALLWATVGDPGGALYVVHAMRGRQRLQSRQSEYCNHSDRGKRDGRHRRHE